MGVEVYLGFAKAGLVYSPDYKAILGMRTNEIELDRQGRMKDAFERGMAFRLRATLLAEGAYGPRSKEAIRRFELREGQDPQVYGLGIKEAWRVDPRKQGQVVHSRAGHSICTRTVAGGPIT